MKIILLFSALFLTAIYADGQQIRVPYRIGKLWGLSDTLGKIIVKPIYDEVLFVDRDKNLKSLRLPDSLFFTKKAGKTGILGTREIIKPLYEQIICVRERFFIATLAGKDTYLHLNGKPMLPKNYEVVAPLRQVSMESYSSKPHFVFFSCSTKTAGQNLYCSDIHKPENSNFLYKGAYLIEYNSRHQDRYNNEMVFNFQKEKDGPVFYLLVKYDEQLKKYVATDTSDQNSFRENRRKGNNGYGNKGYSDGNGTGNGDGMETAIVEADERVPPHPNAPSNYKSPIIINAEFKIKRYSLYTEFMPAITLNHDEPKILKVIKKYNLVYDSVYLQKYDYDYYNSKRNDTLFKYRNSAIYKLKGRYGIIYSDSFINAFCDTIIPYSGRYASKKQYIYGLKGVDNNYKYGLVDRVGKQIIDTIYDEIQYQFQYSKNDYRNSSNWIVMRQGKYGMITSYNLIILEPVYDSLIPNFGVWPSITLLKRDSLFGICYSPRNYDLRLEVIQPFTPFRFSEVKFLNPLTGSKKNYFTVFLLADNSGKKVGYIAKNGTKYFREKE